MRVDEKGRDENSLAERIQWTVRDLDHTSLAQSSSLGRVVRPRLAEAALLVVLLAQHFWDTDELANQRQMEQPSPVCGVLTLIVRVDAVDTPICVGSE